MSTATVTPRPVVTGGTEITWTVNDHKVGITRVGRRTYARIICPHQQTKYLLITKKTGATLPPCPLCDTLIAQTTPQ